MPNEMGFLPQDYLEKRVARRTNIICLTLFLIVTIAIVATFFVTGKQVREVQDLRVAVNQQYDDAARKLEDLEKLQAQKDEMIRKAEVTAVLVEKVPRSRLLAELTNYMPMSLSLTEMKLETKVDTPKAHPRTSLERAKQRAANNKKAKQKIVAPPDTTVTITLIGLAPTDVEVAQFLTALNVHDLFANPELQFSEETLVNDNRMRRFRINLELNQDLNIQHVEPRMVKRQLKNNPLDDDLKISEDGASSINESVMPVSNGFETNKRRSR
ncbi:PilN domain-containing protein [Poriferisphaera sp. WC338]|uniref:PilN domain-containing protein n=1 Tax=Poriferisphaera sp. WC338 TaxID=3425129 RepID=UPI003D813F36